MDLDQYSPAFASDDSVRFCGLRLEVLKKASQDPKVVDALIDELNVQARRARLKALPLSKKIGAIDEWIEAERKMTQSEWYDVHPAEILAAHIWNARKLGARFVDRQLFCDVKREADLCAPVASWLRERDLDACAEVNLGRCRADVLGYKKGGFFSSTRAIAVELKDDDEQIKRGMTQMTTYRDYAHAVYMACTPALIADQLVRHVESRGVHRWDAEVVYRPLREHGFGLLIVEGPKVYEFISPRETYPASAKLAELAGAVTRAKRV